VYGVNGLAPDDSLRALFLRLPADAVLGFHTAAALFGFGVLPTKAVHVVVPAGTVRPRIQGVRVHDSVIPIGEPVELAGVPCVPAARCAVDLARSAPRLNALPVLDAALGARVCTMDDLLAEVVRHVGLKGVRQARELVPLADPRSECVQESQLRLVVIDGGLPAPEPQLWVMDPHGFPLYRLDMGYLKQQVGLEYDGASHLDRATLRRDRERMNWLHANGWTMRFFTDRDLYHRRSYIITAIRSALA
jgi:hypothetical protein